MPERFSIPGSVDVMSDEYATPATCATCGVTYHDDLWVTTCDECEQPVCGECCETITSEDVVCPACYKQHMDRARFR